MAVLPKTLETLLGSFGGGANRSAVQKVPSQVLRKTEALMAGFPPGQPLDSLKCHQALPVTMPVVRGHLCHHWGTPQATGCAHPIPTPAAQLAD